jgi:predicted ABC-type ATPase
MDLASFDRRPLIVVVAGANGAGKTTFFRSHLSQTGLLFVNADHLAQEFNVDSYAAAGMADVLRRSLVSSRESFIFETVFSDPVHDKIEFLERAVNDGYTVVVIFIGIAGPETSDARIAMRLAKGGHDVPFEKLAARFPRVLTNLKAAIRRLPHVFVYDNDDLDHPYRLVAVFDGGKTPCVNEPLPKWFGEVTTD